MFRLWGKEFKDNRMLCDTVIWKKTVMDRQSFI